MILCSELVLLASRGPKKSNNTAVNTLLRKPEWGISVAYSLPLASPLFICFYFLLLSLLSSTCLSATILLVLHSRTCESVIRERERERERRKLTDWDMDRGEGRDCHRFCDNAISRQMEREKKECVRKSVCLVHIRVHVCVCLLTLSLLRFMVHVANGPCITRSPTEGE